MSWVNQYVGTPYSNHGRSDLGLDCWGLVQLVYLQELGVTLPGFEDSYDDSADAGDVLARAWDLWHIVEKPAEFDAVIFWTEYVDVATHIGVSIGGQRFLHCFTKGCMVGDLSHPFWTPRYLGAYRYVA